MANAEVLARGNVVELLKEQLDCLKKCDILGSKLRDSERKTFVVISVIILSLDTDYTCTYMYSCTFYMYSMQYVHALQWFLSLHMCNVHVYSIKEEGVCVSNDKFIICFVLMNMYMYMD